MKKLEKIDSEIFPNINHIDIIKNEEAKKKSYIDDQNFHNISRDFEEKLNNSMEARERIKKNLANKEQNFKEENKISSNASGNGSKQDFEAKPENFMKILLAQSDIFRKDIKYSYEEQSQIFIDDFKKQSESFNKRLEEQSETFNKRLEEQTKTFNERLERQSETFNKRLEEQTKTFNERLERQSETFNKRLEEQTKTFNERLERQTEALSQTLIKTFGEQSNSFRSELRTQTQEFENRLIAQSNIFERDLISLSKIILNNLKKDGKNNEDTKNVEDNDTKSK